MGLVRRKRACASHGGRIVGAAEGGQDVGRHRLHTERQAVDSRRRVHVELRPIDRVGVALDSDLRTRCTRDRVEDARQQFGLEQRRRPPAEEHTGGGGKLAALDVDHTRFDVVVDQMCTIGPRREVAVVAS